MVNAREMKQRKFDITADIELGEYITRIAIPLIGTTGFLDADNWEIMII